MTELSPEAKKLLRIAREEYSPADQRVSAVRSAVEMRIHLARGNGGGGGAGGIGPVAAGALGVPRLLGYGLVAVALAGATVVGVRSLTQTSEAGATESARDALSAPSIAHSATAHDERAAVAADDAADVAPAAAARPFVARKSSDALSAPSAEPSRAEPSRRAAQPAPRAARSHAAPHAMASTAPALRGGAARAQTTAPVSLGTQEKSADDTVARAQSKVEQDAASAAAEPIKPVVDDSLAREIALLKRARAALDGNDPRTALAIADQHATLFATGTMRQERIATRVLALCALHRHTEAAEAKRELERIAPRSPHLMRLRKSCVAEEMSNSVE